MTEEAKARPILKGIYRTHGVMMKDYYAIMYPKGWRMINSHLDYRGSGAWIAEYVNIADYRGTK